jgi:hypothetical protein
MATAVSGFAMEPRLQERTWRLGTLDTTGQRALLLRPDPPPAEALEPS